MPIVRLSCLILPLLLLAAACTRISGAQAPAPSTAEPSPQQRLLAQLSALADKEPRHVGVLYTAAKVAAGIRDQAQAFAWLDRLEQVGLGDELDRTTAALPKHPRIANAFFTPPVHRHGVALSRNAMSRPARRHRMGRETQRVADPADASACLRDQT
jgi:hypothetical protein